MSARRESKAAAAARRRRSDLLAERRQQRVARAARITGHALRDGLPGPAPYILRLARPGESEDVARLLGLAQLHRDEALLASIDDGLAGEVALQALVSTEHRLRALATRLSTPEGVFDALRASAVVLVAVHPDGPHPVGVIVTNPPGGLMRQLMERQAPREHLAMILMAITKIPGLAVDPAHRGAGLGGALLQRVTALAHQTGYRHVYGQVRDRDGLADWYRARGYTVLPDGQGIDLSGLIDAPVGVKPVPGERIFVSAAPAS